MAQAFERIVDLCAEQKIGCLSRLAIQAEGLGKQAAADVRGIGLAIPQFGKGRYAIDQLIIATFGRRPVGNRSRSSSAVGGTATSASSRWLKLSVARQTN